jgi:hypothetical protein
MRWVGYGVSGWTAAGGGSGHVNGALPRLHETEGSSCCTALYRSSRCNIVTSVIDISNPILPLSVYF